MYFEYKEGRGLLLEYSIIQPTTRGHGKVGAMLARDYSMEV